MSKKPYSSYEDRELEILREAVDKAEERTQKAVVNSDQVKKIILIVEKFLQKKKVFAMEAQPLIIFCPHTTNFMTKV